MLNYAHIYLAAIMLKIMLASFAKAHSVFLASVFHSIGNKAAAAHVLCVNWHVLYVLYV